MVFIGPFCIGLPLGWVLYHLLRRRTEAAILSDAGVVIVMAAAGATVVGAKVPGPWAFGAYALGLAIGVFGYLVVALIIDKGGPRMWFHDVFD